VKKTFLKFVAALFVGLVSFASHAQYSARVTLDGDWYLQAGQVENFTPGIDIVAMRYSTGLHENGGAVFEQYIAGDTRDGWLTPQNTHYSVSDWSTSLAAGQTFYFSGLDIDVITNISTNEVDSQNLDMVGTSLRTAYIELTFADGYYKVMHLNQTPWSVTQVLDFGVAPIPEPESYAMMLVGLGVLGAVRRKTKG
jgi:hypothetical protein